MDPISTEMIPVNPNGSAKPLVVQTPPAQEIWEGESEIASAIAAGGEVHCGPIFASWDTSTPEGEAHVGRHQAVDIDAPEHEVNPDGAVMDCIRASQRCYIGVRYPRTNIHTGEVVPSVMSVLEGAGGETWSTSSPYAAVDVHFLIRMLRRKKPGESIRIRCGRGGQCVRIYLAAGMQLTSGPVGKKSPKAPKHGG